MSKRDLSPDSLEAQADALLAAADSMDIPDEIPMPGKSSRSGKAAKAARQLPYAGKHGTGQTVL